MALGAVLFSLGCEEEKITTGGNNQVNRREAAEQAAQTPALPAPVDFQEAEFMETDRSRDPFRSYAKDFVQEGKGRIKSQREVVLGQYSVDELRLVGIVTRINPPKAMLVDPAGVGHVVSRGQFIGRPAVVQPASGAGAAYEVNWRIDRIREGDIVLIREDPANPDVPSATRVIALRNEKDDLVTAEEGGTAASSAEALDRQVEELKKRLESVEQNRTTVEVRQLPRTTGPVPPPPGGTAVVKAPRAN
jgi:type IV pilus assembly protein PilP